MLLVRICWGPARGRFAGSGGFGFRILDFEFVWDFEFPDWLRPRAALGVRVRVRVRLHAVCLPPVRADQGARPEGVETLATSDSSRVNAGKKLGGGHLSAAIWPPLPTSTLAFPPPIGTIRECLAGEFMAACSSAARHVVPHHTANWSTMAPFERLGPYLIERALGSGGMGSVFLGVDEQTGERAAVKVLSPALAADPNFRERFGAEVETLKKLRHPHIVQLLGFGEQDGQLFYAMEMVEGRTLQQELQASRRFTWREVARIGIQICQALKHAHDRGIIHRDLKPANLLYTADEQVKLADFGIAKLYGMTQLTVAGGVIGTADYMSPEQGDGKGVTARSDLYSLGSVLFTLLAGRPPFASRTAAEVIHKLHYEEALPVRRLAPETPEEFELIIAQLLEKDPGKRIATALAVANRLKAMEYALSLETCVAADSDEFEMPADEEYQLADAGQDSSATSAVVETRVVTPADRLTDSANDSLENHRNPTVAMSSLLAPDDLGKETSQTRSTHFTTFDEAARARATALSAPEDNAPLWLKITPLLVAGACIAALVWYFSRPATASSLYQDIMAVAKDGETADLSDVESKMDEYLQRFPDGEHFTEVQDLQAELALYRLQRRYERRIRLRGATSSWGPVERAYGEASSLASTDPIAAATQLRALIDVYAEATLTEADERCLTLAREQLREMEEKGQSLFTEQLKAIEQRLDAADALAGTEPERAAAIRAGVIALYGQKGWARPAVERAQHSLQPPPPSEEAADQPR